MDDEHAEKTTYALLYPFTCVTSKGGPFDDTAFVAGVTVGRIDMALTVAFATGVDRYWVTVPTALVPQLELVGMAHGYPVLTSEQSSEWPEWTLVTFQTEETP